MSTLAPESFQVYLQTKLAPLYRKVHGEKLRLYGPYIGKDKRKRVVVYDPETQKTRSVQYSKIKVEARTGKPVPEGFEVDHRDEDKTNDRFTNLALIRSKKNKGKSNRHRAAPLLKMICPWCGKDFERRKGHVIVKRPSCSRTCRGKLIHLEPRF